MKKLLYLFIVLFMVLLSSCDKEKKDEPTPPTPTKTNRTVLVYIVGDNGNNDLSGHLKTNFADMKLGLESYITDDCNLIVYSEVKNDVPHLIHLSNLGNGVKADTLFTYEEQNPLSKKVMSDIIKQTVSLFPADTYGFVFLSHSTAWLPASTPAMRSIGDYRGTQMDVPVFAEVISSSFPFPLEYILFDSCNMQSIEVAYELRDCANYIIGSPCEIPGPGAPYSVLVPHLFKKENPALDIADTYFQVYNEWYNKSNVTWKYGVSISVLDTQALDKLAIVTKGIIPHYITAQYTASTSGVMRYSLSNPYYDFDGFMESLLSDDTGLYDEWLTAYNNTVIYWNTTATNIFSSASRSMAGSTGLSTYIPSGNYNSTINNFYRTFQWYDDSGWSNTGW